MGKNPLGRLTTQTDGRVEIIVCSDSKLNGRQRVCNGRKFVLGEWSAQTKLENSAHRRPNGVGEIKRDGRISKDGEVIWSSRFVSS